LSRRGVKTITRGTTYASKFESQVAERIHSLQDKHGFETRYEEVKLEYTLKKHYTPDFQITRSDGSIIYVESKGYFDRDARTKMLAVKDQHPDKVFVLLFEQDNSLFRKSKTRYSDWARQHGFDYSVQEIPERWYKV